VRVTGTVYVPGLALRFAVGLAEPQPDNAMVAMNPRQTILSIIRRGIKSLLRAPKSMNMEHGKRSAMASTLLPTDRVRPLLGSSIAVVGVGAVLMVSVDVAVVVVDAIVNDGGAKTHVTCAGSGPQENDTVPV
jgi:hypothetical protein